MKLIRAYVDGSSNGKSGGVGGWGVYLEVIDSKTGEMFKKGAFYNHEKHATNNSMELTAIFMAIQCIKSHKYPIEIISDSKYAINSITKWAYNWREKNSLMSKVNWGLIDEANKAYDKLRKKTTLDIIWVKGHLGTQGNEIADDLAVNARKKKITKLP